MFQDQITDVDIDMEIFIFLCLLDGLLLVCIATKQQPYNNPYQ
jgi:hypothetical protein